MNQLYGYGQINNYVNLPIGVQNHPMQYGHLWNHDNAPGSYSMANRKQGVETHTWYDDVDGDMHKLSDQEKKAKKANARFKRYMFLMASYFFLQPEIATKITTGEVVKHYLSEIGVGRNYTTLFLLFMCGVDIPELVNGRLAFVDGYKNAWLVTAYDHMLGKMKMNDAVRLGSLMLMPPPS